MQCEIACVLANSDLDENSPTKRKGLPRVKVEAGILHGERASVRSGLFAPKIYAIRCHQCNDPPCVTACMSGALVQGEDGVVRVDKEQCVGCGLCLVICPYGAISIDPRKRTAVKCELCQGRDTPACVAACPVGALVLVDLEPGSNPGGG
jgi:carbon-monoxide dehydrogenase iron sulfur subunit